MVLAGMASGQVEVSNGSFRVRIAASQKMLRLRRLLLLLLLQLVLLQVVVMNPSGVSIVHWRLGSLRPQIQRLLVDLKRRHSVAVAHRSRHPKELVTGSAHPFIMKILTIIAKNKKK